MAWFVVQTERTTWVKYLVESRDGKLPTESDDTSEEYLGYVDGDDTQVAITGPFLTKGEAFASNSSRVDGR